MYNPSASIYRHLSTYRYMSKQVYTIYRRGTGCLPAKIEYPSTCIYLSTYRVRAKQVYIYVYRVYTIYRRGAGCRLACRVRCTRTVRGARGRWCAASGGSQTGTARSASANSRAFGSSPPKIETAETDTGDHRN